jgi:hypothetical protein
MTTCPLCNQSLPDACAYEKCQKPRTQWDNPQRQGRYCSLLHSQYQRQLKTRRSKKEAKNG